MFLMLFGVMYITVCVLFGVVFTTTSLPFLNLVSTPGYFIWYGFKIRLVLTFFVHQKIHEMRIFIATLIAITMFTACIIAVIAAIAVFEWIADPTISFRMAMASDMPQLIGGIVGGIIGLVVGIKHIDRVIKG